MAKQTPKPADDVRERPVADPAAQESGTGDWQGSQPVNEPVEAE